MNLAPLLLVVLTPAANGPVSHERIGDGHFRLRITVAATSDVETAQSALLPTAERLCGPQPVRFGRYQWEALERIDPQVERQAVSIRLEQELHCGTAPQVAATPLPDPNWQATSADDQAVRSATAAFFAARAAGRSEQAYAMLSDGMREMTSLADFSEDIRSENARFGSGRRRVVAVTWYNNPSSAPVPGIYAALDYVGEFERLRLLCGYVVWILQSDRSWRLVRSETASLARVDAEDATADSLGQMRAQMGCRG